MATERSGCAPAPVVPCFLFEVRRLLEWWMERSLPATVMSRVACLQSMKPKACEGNVCENTRKASGVWNKHCAGDCVATLPKRLHSWMMLGTFFGVGHGVPQDGLEGPLHHFVVDG